MHFILCLKEVQEKNMTYYAIYYSEDNNKNEQILFRGYQLPCTQILFNRILSMLDQSLFQISLNNVDTALSYAIIRTQDQNFNEIILSKIKNS